MFSEDGFHLRRISVKVQNYIFLLISDWYLLLISVTDFFFKLISVTDILTDTCEWYLKFYWYIWQISDRYFFLISVTDICEWCFRRWSMCQRSWRGCLIRGQPTTCMTQSDRVPAVPWQGAKATSWRWRGTSTSRKTVSPQRASQKLPW